MLYTIFMGMNLKRKSYFLLLLVFLLFSCKSIQTGMINGVSDALAGADKKGVAKKVDPDAPNPMNAFMGESDPVIVQEVLPTIVKLYEIMHIENPSHQGCAIMCGSLNVMYANLCVQTPAESFTLSQLDEQVAEFNRAKLHYLKGRDYILNVFEARFPGFKSAVLGSDEEAIKSAVENLTANDVNACYWASAGALAAFSLDPLDPIALGSLKGPVAMLEKAASFDPDYSNGAIWDVLAQFYVSAPSDFGGDYERGQYCYEQAMRASDGKTAGIYITYAECFCKPNGDREGYLKSLNEALKINPDDDESSRLMTIISQNKAKRLINTVDNYFIEW